jgi:hypothetical protein
VERKGFFRLVSVLVLFSSIDSSFPDSLYNMLTVFIHKLSFLLFENGN